MTALLVALVVVDARAQAPLPQGDPTPVYSICTLLVGKPTTTGVAAIDVPGVSGGVVGGGAGAVRGASASGFQGTVTTTVTAVSGTIRPDGSPAIKFSENAAGKTSALSALEAARQAENLVDLQEKLKAAFHVESVEAASSFGDWLSPGREMLLQAPSGGVRLVIRGAGMTETREADAVRNPDGTITFANRARGTKSANYAVHLSVGDTGVFDRVMTVTVGQRTVFARQLEVGGPVYFIVIAVPTPDAQMNTSATLQTGGGQRPTAVAASGSQFHRVTAPKLVWAVDPVLPAEAKAAGMKSALVIVSATVGTDGLVRNVNVQDPKTSKGGLYSAPPEVQLLAEVAVAAVRQRRYDPARDENGTPMEATIYVSISFKAAGDEPEGDR